MRRLIPVGVALGFIAAWDILVRITGVPPFIFPAPAAVAAAFWDSRALIGESFLVTASETLGGLFLGTLFGAANALLLIRSALARRVLLPFIVFTQAVPVFLLAPILVYWLGFGIFSKIVMTTLVVYFPITAAFYDGLRRTDPGWLEMARVMGATRRDVLWRIRVPAALPAFGSGLRMAAAFAPVGAIIGEWIGASAGLGYQVLLANGRSKVALTFALTIVIALMGVALYWATGRLVRRMTRWAGDSTL